MDPISNMLTAIKNALALKHPILRVPFSKLKYEMGEVLRKNGFIEKVEKKGRIKKFIILSLKYENGRPTISGLKRVSKPGQRIYLPVQKMKRVKSGYGIAIVSTSKGLMTDKEARKQKLGGEVICEVW
jgi:small subunit ribosomal protein S8